MIINLVTIPYTADPESQQSVELRCFKNWGMDCSFKHNWVEWVDSNRWPRSKVLKSWSKLLRLSFSFSHAFMHNSFLKLDSTSDMICQVGPLVQSVKFNSPVWLSSAKNKHDKFAKSVIFVVRANQWNWPTTCIRPHQ